MVEDSIGTSKMGGDRVNGLGIDLLNQSNYLVRRTCMESYLIGEDLWEIINRYSRNALANTPENNNALKKCKQLNAKAGVHSQKVNLSCLVRSHYGLQICP